MKVLLVGLAAALCGGHVAAEPAAVAGAITQLRVHSVHNSLPAARGVMILQLSAATAGGYQWMFIMPDDKNTLSTALSAKLADRTVTVYYDSAILPPWGDAATCAVTAMEIAG